MERKVVREIYLDSTNALTAWNRVREWNGYRILWVAVSFRVCRTVPRPRTVSPLSLGHGGLDYDDALTEGTR